MGTRFELVLVAAGADTPRERRRLRAAGAAALEVIEACDARWSLFRRDSLVARIRREAGREPVRVDEDTWRLLSASLELWHATGGAFDVGLGAEMEALGFRGRAARARRFEPPGEPPYALDPAARSVRTSRPGALIDLGGVAKGCALDLAARELRDCGVETALLHGGTSSVVALGAPPSDPEPGAAPGWRVGVEAPGVAQALTARLADASLSVSAPRGRTSEAGGHVLDPRTGRPAPGALTACVVAADGLSADALATALVAGGTWRQNLTLPSSSSAAPTAVALAEPDAGRWTFAGASARVFETRDPETP